MNRLRQFASSSLTPPDSAAASHRHGHDHHHDHTHEEEGVDEVEEENIQYSQAIIFDANKNHEDVPEGFKFNAIKIRIDGTVNSSLSWKESHDAAERYIKSGLNIFWEIDLGLDRLKQPLSSQSQFLSLCLSLEHFRDTLWKAFRRHTVGLCFYRGTLDLSAHFPWDEEQNINMREWLRELFGDEKHFQEELNNAAAAFNLETITHATLKQSALGHKLIALFSREALGDYLNLLAERLPDTLSKYILFDCTCFHDDPLLTAHMLSQERYPRFTIGVKGACLQSGELGWDHEIKSKGVLTRSLASCPNEQPATIGLCLPPLRQALPLNNSELSIALKQIQSRAIAYRSIPEELLTAEWHGLDSLIVYPKGMSQQGLRKLRGFCAAGGQLLPVESS